MARMKVWPGSARSKFWYWAKNKAMASKATTSGKATASSWILNRNSSSVYNTGSTNNTQIKKPGTLTSRIWASKPVTKRR